MSDCQRCEAKSPNAFLCPRCQTSVHRTLREMPWWLQRLTEAAVGQTRMSDNGGRKSARRKDLDGDAELASYIEPLPNNRDDDLEKARRDRQKAALAHALATGGVNAKASTLLAEIHDSLGYWVRVLCEARGIQPPLLNSARTLGVSRALWLAANITAIAASEDAGEICSDIEGHHHDIVDCVNRPIRWWILGDCPQWLDPAHDREAGPCGAPLRVPAQTTEVSCRKCKARHNVQLLLLARKYDAEGQPMSRKKLVRYNGDLPSEFQVPPRTLRDWLDRGALAPCGADIEGDPLYSWVDVRLLMLNSKHASVTRRVP